MIKPVFSAHGVTISRRRYDAMIAAEELCRAVRFIPSRPGDWKWPVTAEEIPRFHRLLIAWMDKSGKAKYRKPEGWPVGGELL